MDEQRDGRLVEIDSGDAFEVSLDDDVENASRAFHSVVALVSTDGRCRVTSWNEGAEELFEFRPAQVQGHPLYQILDARDLFGNRMCRWGCSIQESIRLGETIRPFVLHARTAGGQFVRAAVTVERLRDEGAGAAPGLLHRMKPDGRRRTRDRRSIDQQTIESLLVKPAVPGYSAPQLTASELKVLKLLVAGSATQAIADSLTISAATVRNHTQHILRKLRAHSKLQAVSIALRGGYC